MSFHKKISYIKSGLRIMGFFILPFQLMIGAWFLIVAEILGIAEEKEEK